MQTPETTEWTAVPMTAEDLAEMRALKAEDLADEARWQADREAEWQAEADEARWAAEHPAR